MFQVKQTVQHVLSLTYGSFWASVYSISSSSIKLRDVFITFLCTWLVLRSWSHLRYCKYKCRSFFAATGSRRLQAWAWASSFGKPWRIFSSTCSSQNAFTSLMTSSRSLFQGSKSSLSVSLFVFSSSFSVFLLLVPSSSSPASSSSSSSSLLS